MSDTKMLQAIINDLAILKENDKRLEKKIDDGFKNTTERVDKLGLQLAEV